MSRPTSHQSLSGVCGDIRSAFVQSPAYRVLRHRTLALTVTSGRSGTALLANLLKEAAGLDAEHEPGPRLNFEFRPALQDPVHALRWLAEVKLPAIAERASAIYVETSHLFCKGFLEPLLFLGIAPKLIVLRRGSREVAVSLYRMNVIPARTEEGRTVLLAPDDFNVLPLIGWQELNDYQLCFWYALEIARRQRLYGLLAEELRLRAFDVTMDDLLRLERFAECVDFIAGEERCLDVAAYERVTGTNQNPRDKARPGNVDRAIDDDLDTLEREVLDRIRLAWPGPEETLLRYREDQSGRVCREP